MITKCPKCNNWCESSEKETFSEKIIKGGGSFLERGIFSIPQITESVLNDYYKFKCNKCGYQWNDNNSNDQTKEYDEERKIFELTEKVRFYCNQSKQEQVKYIEKLINEIDSSSYIRLKSRLYDTLAYASFFFFNDTIKALEYINKSIKIANNYSSIALKGIISGEARTANDNYKKLQNLNYYKKAEASSCFLLTTDDFQFHLYNNIIKYSEHFLEIPYIQRRFLVIDSDFNYLPDSFKVLPINHIPTNILFPTGHPQEKTLYVCHPYKNNLYIPFENYQLELFRDEVNEFVQILQCLGAKKTKVYTESEKNKTDYKNKENEEHLGGKYAKQEINLQHAKQDENKIFEQIKNKFNRIEKFEKLNEPHLPQDLIWYYHRPEWQLLREKRMNGITYFTETISNDRNTVINENEIQQLNADFKNLVLSANINYKQVTQSEFKLHERYNLIVEAEFYPLSSYNKTPQITENNKQKNNNKIIYLIIGGLVLIIICILGLIITIVR